MLFFLAVPSQLAAAIYYVDPNNGNDSNPGSSEQPWQTMVRAMRQWTQTGTKVTSGDTVILRSGNYGVVSFDKPPVPAPASWNDKITYKAETGATPVFNQLEFLYNDHRYLEFDGITLVQTDKIPRNAISVVKIRGAQSIRLKNLKITGCWTDMSYAGLTRGGIEISASNPAWVVSDILIDNCEITLVQQGIFTTACTLGEGIIIRNNYIHHTSNSGIMLASEPGNGRVVVENNNIYYEKPALSFYRVRCAEGNIIGTFAKYEEVTQDITNASGLYWDPDIPNTIQFSPLTEVPLQVGAGKHIRAAGSGAMMKDPEEIVQTEYAHASGIALRIGNVEIRGNTIRAYGSTNALLTYPGDPKMVNGFCDLLIENNLFYDSVLGHGVSLRAAGSNIIFRNNTVIGTHVNSTNAWYYGIGLHVEPLEGKTGQGVKIYNNIIVGAIKVDTALTDYEEDNNLFYSALNPGWVAHLKGNYTIIYTTGTTQPTVFESGFFVDPDYSHGDNYEVYPGNGGPSGIEGDYHLLASATAAINRADSLNAPAADKEGRFRVGLADVGCYEYSTVPPGEQPPSANAGTDQEITDADNNGSEPVTLDGSSSTDPQGSDTIQSYLWQENSTQIASGITAQVNLPIGEHVITLMVTDSSGLSGTDTITVNVLAYSASSNNAPNVAAIPSSLNKNEGTVITADEIELATDTDGDTLTYTFSGWAATLPINIDYDQAGEYVLHVEVTDGIETVGKNITICVNNINRGPALSALGAKTTSEASTLEFPVTAVDPDGDQLSYIAENLPGEASFTDNVFRWIPDYNQAGLYNVTFIVSDGQLQDSKTISITVANTNRPPVIEPIGNITVVAGSQITFPVNTSDADGDNVSITPSDLPAGATFNSPFSWTPAPDQVGNYQITFIASDGQLQDSETISISVIVGNIPPILTVIGDKTISEGESLTFTVTAADADNDPISYLVESLPQGATFIGNTFSWSPNYDQSGIYAVIFIASDGQLQDRQSIAITVDNYNRAPVFNEIGDQQVNEASRLEFQISATDPDGNQLTYSVQNSPAGSTFTDDTFNWTPGYDQAGAYEIIFWAGDGSTSAYQTVNITVVNVNRAPVLAPIGNKEITVTSNESRPTLNFTVAATDPDGDAITYGVENLPPQAVFENGGFTWSPQLYMAGQYSLIFTAGDGDKSDSQSVLINVIASNKDTTAPTLVKCSPAPGSFQVSLNTLITLTLADNGEGINPDSVVITVEGNQIYQGNIAEYNSEYGRCQRSGNGSLYTYTFQAARMFDFDQAVAVTVNAADLAGNAMKSYAYAFRTEMRTFGVNQLICRGIPDEPQVSAKAVSDSSGNLWAVSEIGQPGGRDIYIYKLPAGEISFAPGVRISDSPSDECHPSIALDSSGRIYVCWQDNRRGNWDIYGATAVDGVNWSEAVRITKLDSDQISPALAGDPQQSGSVYVVWQDNRSGNQDIYLTTLNDNFAGQSEIALTSDSADQTEPALAIDNNHTIYVVWMDERNGNADIYGAASNLSWSNIPLVKAGYDQASPAMAVEPLNGGVHLLWTDNTTGNRDIMYAATNNLAGGPLTGTSIVDDTTGADQFAPSIALAPGSATAMRIFACWQDERNSRPARRDSDIYFVELSGDSLSLGTNIFVPDDGCFACQRNPVICTGLKGQSYLFWIDDRDKSSGLYYTCSTVIQDNPLATATIDSAAGGIVGALPDNIQAPEDVSLVIPPGAFWSDVTVNIWQVEHPQSSSGDLAILAAYELGPSSRLEFPLPVTVTIPYDVSEIGPVKVWPYWLNPRTGLLCQSGISDIQELSLTETLKAIRFKTTHFSQYVIGRKGKNAK